MVNSDSGFVEPENFMEDCWWHKLVLTHLWHSQPNLTVHKFLSSLVVDAWLICFGSEVWARFNTRLMDQAGILIPTSFDRLITGSAYRVTTEKKRFQFIQHVSLYLLQLHWHLLKWNSMIHLARFLAIPSIICPYNFTKSSFDNDS